MSGEKPCACIACSSPKNGSAAIVSSSSRVGGTPAGGRGASWRIAAPRGPSQCLVALLALRLCRHRSPRRRDPAPARYHRRMARQLLFGFHAVTVRLKTAPRSVLEVHVDATRRDQRMRQFVERAMAAGARIVESDDQLLQKMSGTARHQGVVARVEALAPSHSLDDTLD